MKKFYYYTYKITCTEGSFKGKFYFGQHTTNNLNDGYIASGRKIKCYLRKHPNGYIREILNFYDSKEALNKAEYDLIHPWLNHPDCLNLMEGGFGGDSFSNLSEERKQEISKKKSESLKGKNKGKKLSEVQKQHLSEINKGKKLSEDTKRKMSESRSGENNPMFGKHTYGFKGHNHTEETKQKISEIRKGKSYLTDDGREKISKIHKGKPKSEAQKRKISESLKGHKISEETKQKISKSCKGHAAPNKGKKMSDEVKQKISNSAKGKHRVYDNEEHTKWHLE